MIKYNTGGEANMIRYSLLYKDNDSKICYFYNLDDNNIYTDKKQIDLKLIKRLSFLGAFVGVLLYSFLKLFNIKDIAISTAMALIVLLIAVIIGWIVSMLIINNTTKFFVNENKQEAINEKIKEMYNKNQLFRRRYKLLLFYGIIFTMINTFILFSTSINLIELICVMLLWVVFSVMFFVNRPICSNELKKICTDNN